MATPNLNIKLDGRMALSIPYNPDSINEVGELLVKLKNATAITGQRCTIFLDADNVIYPVKVMP